MEDGRTRLTVRSHEGSYDEVVDKALIGAGRAPNLEGLGLETAGVKYTQKGVSVNDYLQTSNPRIYAAGDICSSYQLRMPRISWRASSFKMRCSWGERKSLPS